MGRQGKSTRAEPTSRERLIAAAAEHLARSGPRGVELRAICQEVGVAPSLVNYHFESPAELLYSAALYGYRGHVVAQRRALERAQGAAPAVERWVLNTLAWKRDATGIAAVIDYPMLALGGRGEATPDEFVTSLAALSRENVTTLGSAVYALLTNAPVRRISTARVAALIRINREFAFWISNVGFSAQGGGTWIAGRAPYGRAWRVLGFDADRQIESSLRELVARMAGTGQGVIPDPDSLPIAPDDERDDERHPTTA